MRLEKFKEKDNKRIGIITFTIVCILLVSGVILYRTFAIFVVKTNQNVINGKVGDMGDVRFMVYVENEIQKDMPQKNSDYSLDTSKSYCEDITDSSKRSHISWNQEKWSIEIKDIGTTKTKCYLYFDKLYVDSTLNAEDGGIGPIPDLGNELVAITFNEQNGHALKADLTKDWYNYGEQKWANAVILKNKEDYQVGEEIPETNIESYFVWIPRYEYQIWNGAEETNLFINVNPLGTVTNPTQNENLNQAKEVKINFVTKNDTIKIGTNIDDWLTHPAFISFNSNGFWVGKFETGYNQNDDIQNLSTNGWTSENAEKNVDKISPNHIVIKPNVYTWRNINVSNAFYTSYNYQRELESHMMKNMEWGAIAYLTNSKYGRCANQVCNEVRINNSKSFVTGSSAINAPIVGVGDYKDYEWNNLNENSSKVLNYNDSKSVVSSTTNNYYGIYDMVGGAWEYVMAVMQVSANISTPASGSYKFGNSGFRGPYSSPNSGGQTEQENTNGLPWPSSKYYDLYDYDTTSQHYYRGKFGDATKESGPFYQIFSVESRLVSAWNADDASFVNSSSPWFRRGGYFTDGTCVGISAFINGDGTASSISGFRIVLTP